MHVCLLYRMYFNSMLLIHPFERKRLKLLFSNVESVHFFENKIIILENRAGTKRNIFVGFEV